jgi:hypothetical protein
MAVLAKPPTIDVLNGPVIDAGQAYSAVVSLEGAYVVGLITPDDWTPSVATVQVSAEGDNYYDLFDGKGVEFIFNVVPGTMINVDPNLLMMAAHIRLRSGRRNAEVLQESVRRFYLVTKQNISAIAE